MPLTESALDLPLDTAVVGAGLGGLAAGFELQRRGARVRVLEAKGHGGGVATSRRIGGYLFEAGPNTVPAGARNLRELAGRLGIADRLVAADPAARVRHLWFGGRLRTLPTTPPALVTTGLLSLASKLRIATEALRPWQPAADDTPEPSLAALLTERIGAEATDLFAGAFVRGVYAGDHRRLGAKSAFPRLWERLERHGGLLRGLARAHGDDGPPAPGPDVPAARLLSFPEGLGELAGALQRELGQVLLCDARVERLSRVGARWRLTLADGRALEARTVVLAVGPRAAASLLADAGLPDAARALAGIECRGVRLVHLGFAPGALALPPGFGFLVPPPEALTRRGRSTTPPPEALGALFPSNLFAGRAPHGGAAVTCFFPDSWARGADERQRAELAAADLGHALRLDRAPTPEVSWCLDWPAAIPQYGPGHGHTIAVLEAELARAAPGLALGGSYTGGVAVDQVLARGRTLALRLAGNARGVPST